MQKIKINKQAAIFLILAAVLLVEVFILIPWGLGRIARVNQKIRELKEQVDFVRSDWPRRDEYIKENIVLKEKIDKYNEKIISSGQETKLISFISQNSRTYNIRIDSITPLGLLDSDSSGFSNVPFRIEAQGSFPNLVNFLRFLQENTYFFELKELRISGYNPSRINMILWGLKERN